ncbi:MAG: hypothetical protein M3179_10840 [Actinomycetota bacterium]|nr:hypothetical protein [Actinomycetota bacterium]
MKPDSEDGLRRALTAYADTTTTSPDAWDEVLDRAERGSSRRRLGLSIGAVTAAMALIAAGVVWVARPHAPTNEDLLSAVDATTAQDRFAFSLSAGVADMPPTSAQGQFDRQRGVGWVRVPPTQLPSPPGVSVQPPVPATSGADAVFDEKQVFLRSELVAVAASIAVDRPWVAFDRAGARDSLDLVAAVGGRPNLVSIMDRVTASGGAGVVGQVPDRGATFVPDGVEEIRGVATTRYRVEPHPPLVDGLPGEVRGVVTPTVWIDAQGLLRRVQTRDADYTDTVELYDFGAPLLYDIPPGSEVTPASTLDWKEFSDPTHPREDRATRGPANDDPSFFSLRPVIRRLDPPCEPRISPTSAVLPVYPGQPEACYELRPPALDASAVASAEANRSDATGEWVVDFTLTPEGEIRFRAMADQLRVGGQIAIVIDDVVLSAPTLETELFSGRGQISAGFDEGSALELADRLNAAGPPR